MRDCDGTQELILGVPRLTVVAESEIAGAITGAMAGTLSGAITGAAAGGTHGDRTAAEAASKAVPVSRWGIPVISSAGIHSPAGASGSGGGDGTAAAREVGAYEQALKNRLREYFGRAEELERRRLALLASAGLDTEQPYEVFWFPRRGVYVFRTVTEAAPAGESDPPPSIAGRKGGMTGVMPGATAAAPPPTSARQGTSARRELLAALESAATHAAAVAREVDGGGQIGGAAPSEWAEWAGRLAAMAQWLRRAVEGGPGTGHGAVP